MFKVDTFQSLFNCAFCSKLLVDPVSLPCGETVCKLHVQDKDSIECTLCYELHQIPKEGFLVNKAIQKQLDLKLDTLNVDKVGYFQDCREVLKN